MKESKPVEIKTVAGMLQIVQNPEVVKVTTISKKIVAQMPTAPKNVLSEPAEMAAALKMSRGLVFIGRSWKS